MARAETRTGGRDATRGVIHGDICLSVGKPALPEPDRFVWTPLADMARLESGHTPSRSNPRYWDGDIPWIGIRDATGNHGRRLIDTEQHVTQLGIDNSSARVLPPNTVCLSRTASVGFVVTMGVPMATSQDFVNWVCGPSLNHRYLHFALLLEQRAVRERFAHGSTHQTMYYPEAKALHLLTPPRPMQDGIAEVLGALDDKIAANDLTLSTTTQLEDAIFRHGVQASAARPRLVSELASFLNRRRVPLSSRERSMRKGTVPYYGAAGRIDYVDEPLFTEPIILVGEDGTVQTSDGRAVVQYVWGPSWVNNHAHVLVGRQVSTDFLRVALRTLPVADAVTGAAQPKLSMSRLSALSLLLPDELRIQELTARYAASAGVIRSATEESRRLAALRDALLPELMSGRLRVKDAEKSVEEVV